MASNEGGVDEARELRTRAEAIERAIDGLASMLTEGTPSAFAATGNTEGVAYPTGAGSWFLLIPQSVTGTEEEGQPAGAEDTGDPGFLAWNTGTTVPGGDSKVLAFHVGNHWYF